jgi:hypothetical protein
VSLTLDPKARTNEQNSWETWQAESRPWNAVSDIRIRLQESDCVRKLDAGRRSGWTNRKCKRLMITRKCRAQGQLVRPPINGAISISVVEAHAEAVEWSCICKMYAQERISLMKLGLVQLMIP